jgi:hypothetical protein
MVTHLENIVALTGVSPREGEALVVAATACACSVASPSEPGDAVAAALRSCGNLPAKSTR